MAEHEVVAVTLAAAVEVPTQSDHKRKLEDLELEDPKLSKSTNSEPDDLNLNSEVDGVGNTTNEDVITVSDESEPKRLRLDEKPEGVEVSENGHKAEKVEDDEEVNGEQLAEVNEQVQDAQGTHKENPETLENEERDVDNRKSGDAQHSSIENPVLGYVQQPSLENPELGGAQQPSVTNHDLRETENTTGDSYQLPSSDMSQKDDAYVEQQPTSDTVTISRKLEVPNNKVGVLIGKSGDTIRMLQYNSGARIQITRDLEADPHAPTRPIELTGSLENVTKAEKLIKDVIAEADAGGSPSLVARGLSSAHAAGSVEQIQMQVPNEKVGMIIGKGGETIKGLQTRSGARIQLIPQHLPDGDLSKERTVRVSGDKQQIEMAKELIKEVMSQTARQPPNSTNYNQQQGNRFGGPGGHAQWGPRGPPYPTQPMPYDNHHRAPYPPQHYNNYPPQQQPPRGGGGYNSGWGEPRHSGPPPQGGGGYDYYGGPTGGHGPTPYPTSNFSHGGGPSPSPAPPMGPPPYNYGQPSPYQQAPPPQQSYGQYENQQQQPYGGGPGYAQQGAVQPGYAPQQQQYGKPPPSYGMQQAQGPPLQSYGPPPPRATTQPAGDYQGNTISSNQYGQNMPPQYPYAPSGGPMQQSYPAPDGYNQPPHQGGPPPVQGGFGQPGPNYAHGGPPAGYGSYPAPQQGVDPGYGTGQGPMYGAPTINQQPGYGQAPGPGPGPVQVGYDQSVAQPGGYGTPR